MVPILTRHHHSPHLFPPDRREDELCAVRETSADVRIVKSETLHPTPFAPRIVLVYHPPADLAPTVCDDGYRPAEMWTHAYY